MVKRRTPETLPDNEESYIVDRIVTLMRTRPDRWVFFCWPDGEYELAYHPRPFRRMTIILRQDHDETSIRIVRPENVIISERNLPRLLDAIEPLRRAVGPRSGTFQRLAGILGAPAFTGMEQHR